GDASTRRFHRLCLPGGGTRVVMDYGAAFEGETDDVRLARIFERAALPAARVLEVLPEAGCLILEDLGSVTLERALSAAPDAPPALAARAELYAAAVGLLVEPPSRGTEALRASERAAGPALDDNRFLFEMHFFLEHFVAGYLGRTSVPEPLTDELEGLARTI